LLGTNGNRIIFKRVSECCVDNLVFVLYTDIIIFVMKGARAMKLSTRGRYATRALLDLALHQGEEPTPLKDIAQRQQISVHYLEHLITPLIRGGILLSTRGARGGVWLTKTPEEIRLNEVIQLVEGSLAPVECVNNPDICNRSASCVTRDVWDEMKRAMNGVLESITLQDLVERQRQKGQVGATMYYI